MALACRGGGRGAQIQVAAERVEDGGPGHDSQRRGQGSLSFAFLCAMSASISGADRRLCCGQATYNGKLFSTTKGPLTCKSLRDCQLG
eukprot:880730-Rhodomonas_salina.2